MKGRLGNSLPLYILKLSIYIKVQLPLCFMFDYGSDPNYFISDFAKTGLRINLNFNYFVIH